MRKSEIQRHPVCVANMLGHGVGFICLNGVYGCDAKGTKLYTPILTHTHVRTHRKYG